MSAPQTDTRRAIMEAASRLFADKGFERTTTKAIASEAGVAEGSIYTYFRSKRDILLAFAEEVGLESARRVFEEMEGLPDEELVTAFIDSRLRLFQEYGPVIKALIGQALFDPEIAQMVRTRIVFPAAEVMRAYIERRIQEGRFRGVDPDAAVKALLSQHLGMVVLHSILSEDVRDVSWSPQLARELAHLFLRGIAR